MSVPLTVLGCLLLAAIIIYIAFLLAKLIILREVQLYCVQGIEYIIRDEIAEQDKTYLDCLWRYKEFYAIETRKWLLNPFDLNADKLYMDKDCVNDQITK